MHHLLTCGRWGSGKRGYSLTEVIVSVTVLGFLGVAFTRMLVAHGRFSDQQNAYRNARAVSRQSMNLLLSELRMVQDSGGIDSATADGKTIRVIVPYRFGLNCGTISSRNVVSMLPIDSVVAAQAVYKGYAWRNTAGRYTLVFPAAPLGADAPVVSSSYSAQCTGSGTGQARIRAVTVAGRTGQVLDIRPATSAAPKGQAVFFFQRVTYAFKPSTAFPGRLGLWRKTDGGTDDELIAPFDTTSRFKYWAATAAMSVSAPPALDSIRGLDIIFAGSSTYAPTGKSAPVKSTVVTSVFFKNVRAY